MKSGYRQYSDRDRYIWVRDTSTPTVAGPNDAGTCEVFNAANVSVGIFSFNAALTLALNNNNYTIKLLTDITTNTPITVSVTVTVTVTGKTVTFDLDGHWTLTVNTVTPASMALTVLHQGEVKLKNEKLGTAEFNVIGISSGIYALNGAKAAVSNATVKHDGTSDEACCVYVEEAGTITVSGNVTALGVSGFDVFGVGAVGGKVYVGGNVEGKDYGVYASGNYTSVTVNGNTVGGLCGAYAYSYATVDVKGDATGGIHGALVRCPPWATTTATSITVGGNATGLKDCGVRCEISAGQPGSGEVTVNGKVNSGGANYLFVGTVSKATLSNNDATSVKPGYKQYSNGVAMSGYLTRLSVRQSRSSRHHPAHFPPVRQERRIPRPLPPPAVVPSPGILPPAVCPQG